MNKPGPISGRERVARRRAALRAQGLRPKQFWVPDVHSPEFREQARHAALAVASSEEEADVQAWIDSSIDWDSLPPYDAPLED